MILMRLYVNALYKEVLSNVMLSHFLGKSCTGMTTDVLMPELVLSRNNV